MIVDNFRHWDILKQLYSETTLKVKLQFLKSPKGKNEELAFSKLQFNYFSLITTLCSLLTLITTVSCSNSTLPVYGFWPKIAPTCEISKIRAARIFLYRVDFGIASTTHPNPHRLSVVSMGILPSSRVKCLLKTHNATIRWQRGMQIPRTKLSFQKPESIK